MLLIGSARHSCGNRAFTVLALIVYEYVYRCAVYVYGVTLPNRRRLSRRAVWQGITPETPLPWLEGPG
jgi:hypothetical protein